MKKSFRLLFSCILLVCSLTIVASAESIVPASSTTIRTSTLGLMQSSGVMKAKAKLIAKATADTVKITGLKIQRRIKGSKNDWETAATAPTAQVLNDISIEAEVTCKHDPAYEYRAYAKFYAKIGEKSDSIGKYTGIK